MAEFVTIDEIAKRLENKPQIIKEMLEYEPRYQIARAIIAERIRRGWNQGTLARKARLTQAQVSRLERGRIGNFATVAKALDALDLKLEIKPKRQAN
ncbi:helix-turn-helix domain-containing protein [Desulfofundulus salinus]|uniref:Helix-turn-helix domain-containing protein n=1 Tax=Desulfofundulus salinus TaxID=2419843 RepID=A0A494WTI8_9FIRM|nr:XRE family transcriptional regulator [Desulfofundulus salinum]RKO66706.1 helix-turn-helix domain-containing protein [Desulfofundulus salinum]